MNWFRITKYNPALRGSKNFGSDKDSWTSFSDIGKVFGGELLTIERYLEVENDYVGFYLNLLETHSIQELRLKELEIYDDEGNKWSSRSFVSSNEFNFVLRDMLREHSWGKLIGEGGLEIHFGYDLYTYLGVDEHFDVYFRGSNVFVEKIDASPYCAE